MAIAAIPTKYKHVQFRSRLEARWAAFFDLGKRRWAYEPFELEGYIPDFILYGQRRNALVEIKPEYALDLGGEKMRRAAEFCAAQDWRLIVLTDNVYRPVHKGRWFGFDTEQFYEDEPIGISCDYFLEYDYTYPWLKAGWILAHGRTDVENEKHWIAATLWERPSASTPVLEFGYEDVHHETLDGEWCPPGDSQYWEKSWAEAGNTVQWRRQC
jgi:hypothetical protein